MSFFDVGKYKPPLSVPSSGLGFNNSTGGTTCRQELRKSFDYNRDWIPDKVATFRYELTQMFPHIAEYYMPVDPSCDGLIGVTISRDDFMKCLAVRFGVSHSDGQQSHVDYVPFDPTLTGKTVMYEGKPYKVIRSYGHYLDINNRLEGTVELGDINGDGNTVVLTVKRSEIEIPNLLR